MQHSALWFNQFHTRYNWAIFSQSLRMPEADHSTALWCITNNMRTYTIWRSLGPVMKLRYANDDSLQHLEFVNLHPDDIRYEKTRLRSNSAKEDEQYLILPSDVLVVTRIKTQKRELRTNQRPKTRSQVSTSHTALSICSNSQLTWINTGCGYRTKHLMHSGNLRASVG